MRGNEKIMVVNKDKVRTIKVAESLMNMLAIPAIKKALFISRASYERYQGALAITDSVIESEILPNSLMVKKDREEKKEYFCQDAYGNYRKIVDVYSFFNDIVAESSDFGFTSEQMAVALAYGYGYEGPVIGVSRDGMINSQLEAYYALEEQKAKGASK